MFIMNRTLRTKMTVIVSAGASLIILAAVVGLFMLTGALNRFELGVSGQRQAFAVQEAFRVQVQEWKNVLLRGHNPADLDKYWAAFENEEKKVQEQAAAVIARDDDPETKALFTQFAEAHQTLGNAYRKGLQAYKDSGLKASAGDQAVKGIDRAPTELLDKAVQHVLDHADAERAAAKAAASRALLISLMGLAIGTIAGVSLVRISLKRTISSPLERQIAAIERIAGGDFTANAVVGIAVGNRRDEIGRLTQSVLELHGSVRLLIGQMAGSSRAVVEAVVELNQTSEQSASAAEEIAQSVTQLAAGATSQATDVDAASRTLEGLLQAVTQIAAGAQEQAGQVETANRLTNEMAHSIEAITDHATQTAAVSRIAGQTAREGAEIVKKTVDGMGRIQESVLSAGELVSQLGHQSQQIGEIVQAITDIADQTNLLALNAAIEAARAGEHGRGFAVVADEVRKLAERSGKSAAEISQLIARIQQGISGAVAAMERGTEEVEAGAKLAAAAGQALQAIQANNGETERSVSAIVLAAQALTIGSRHVVEAIDAVAAVTQENSAASEEMAAGANQVAEAVTGVAAVSQENAASAEEVSAAIEELTAGATGVAAAAAGLSRIAQTLQDQVSRFQYD